jgi:hypothetical protein
MIPKILVINMLIAVLEYTGFIGNLLLKERNVYRFVRCILFILTLLFHTRVSFIMSHILVLLFKQTVFNQRASNHPILFLNIFNMHHIINKVMVLCIYINLLYLELRKQFAFLSFEIIN